MAIKNFQTFFQINEVTIEVYRGLSSKFDESKTKDIIWVSTSKEHAEIYQSKDGELKTFSLDLSKLEPLNLGYRAVETSVQYKDIQERLIEQILEERFATRKINETKAINLVERCRELKFAGHKQVWEWVHVNDILKIIKEAGFNAIIQNEGMKYHSGSVSTYGILDKRLLKLLR
jgi:hypothetical protein